MNLLANFIFFKQTCNYALENKIYTQRSRIEQL